MAHRAQLVHAFRILGATLFIGCAQPPTPCLLANAVGGAAVHSPGTAYLAVYYYRPGSETGSCSGGAFDFEGLVYAEVYGTLGTGQREVVWTPGEFAYDVNTGSPPDPTRDPGVRGHFTQTTVDKNGLCLIEGTAPGQQEIAGVLVTYDFKRVQVASSAAVQGTEILADVLISRGTCSHEYDALGIWPAVPCATNTDCDPLPDPTHGRPNGSGLLPALPVECNTGPLLEQDAGTGWCFFPDAGPTGFPFLSTVH